MAEWVWCFLDVPRVQWGESLAFWSSALSCEVSSLRGEHDQFATLLPAAGRAAVKTQAIDAGPAGIHLDLDSTDRDAAFEQSVALGAEHLRTYDGVPVMRSPGGLTFCHTLSTPVADDAPETVAACVLDQVCIDIPPRLWEAEVRFWQALTGRDLEAGLLPQFAFLGAPGSPRPLRILLQRLDDDAPSVTAHPDLATVDRASEARRHESLGAVRVTDNDRWTVMRAPSGHTYCLTDRDPATGRRKTG